MGWCSPVGHEQIFGDLQNVFEILKKHLFQAPLPGLQKKIIGWNAKKYEVMPQIEMSHYLIFSSK